MAHAEKYTKSSVGQLCQHYERKKLPDGNYVKFGNEDIDTSRTYLNYNLAPERGLKGQIEFIGKRCGEVKCLNRADVNVMCSWIVTLPKNFPEEKAKDFFQFTYNFLNERYGGEQNVISAYVHMDEKTPHMHYAFVPVVKDRKTGKEKVSAKETIDKKDLLTFHTDLEKHLKKHLGFEAGVINGATLKGNISIKALKLQSEIERGRQEKFRLDVEASRRAVEARETEARVARLKTQENALEGSLRALKRTLKDAEENAAKKTAELDGKLSKIKKLMSIISEIEHPEGYTEKKSLLGGTVTRVEMNVSAFRYIQELALGCINEKNRADKLQQELQNLEKSVNTRYVKKTEFDSVMKIVSTQSKNLTEISEMLKKNPELEKNFQIALQTYRRELENKRKSMEEKPLKQKTTDEIEPSAYRGSHR